MGNVYKNAAVTIAATMTSKSTAGIFSSRPLKRDMFSLSPNYQSTAYKMHGTLHFRESKHGRLRFGLIPSGPLTTRAWRVQENVLSTRTLHFGREELVWECNTRYETESEQCPSFHDGALQHLRLQARENTKGMTRGRGDQHSKLLERWYDIISEFGARGLTFPNDKLPAISGVAQEIHDLTCATYRAGLWREDLHLGLL
jgi:hypothetical protein